MMIYVPQRQEVERQFVTEGARYATQLEEQHPLPLQRRNTLGFIEHVTFTQHVSGTSLSVSWGTPKSKLVTSTPLVVLGHSILATNILNYNIYSVCFAYWKHRFLSEIQQNRYHPVRRFGMIVKILVKACIKQMKRLARENEANQYRTHAIYMSSLPFWTTRLQLLPPLSKIRQGKVRICEYRKQK
jgi:hypothetical protein